MQLAKRAKAVTFLLLDVDGVLTDGRIIYDSDGREIKAFDIHDGAGLSQLRRAGFSIGLLSGRMSKAVDVRAKELEIDIVHQGIANKLAVYESLLDRCGLRDEQVAYVGDDLIDLPLFDRVGLAVAVASAQPAVRRAAHWVTRLPGGRGAVREVTDFLIRSGSRPAAKGTRP